MVMRACFGNKSWVKRSEDHHYAICNIIQQAYVEELIHANA
jgi:hypothetical protein